MTSLRFKYYHWTLALLGVVLNLGVSITAGWYIALTALAMALLIYKYVEFKGYVGMCDLIFSRSP